MRICIFGAGALGGALGAILARQNDVTLVGRKDNMAAIGEKGLVLTGDARRRVRVRAVETISSAEPADLLLITTKAYDTSEAVDECRGWAGQQTIVLTLQNGLGNLEILREWKGRKAFGGTTTMGATLVAPGRIGISGFGKTSIGSDLDPAGAGLIAGLFNDAGIPAHTVRDVRSEIWSKAAVSSCINPLTAILRVRNGMLLEGSWPSKFMDGVARECVMVAAAEGVALSLPSIRARVRAVARNTAGNLSSMLQDVMSAKRTEIGQINGAFARYGESHRIATPLNRMLTAAVESLTPKQDMQKVNIPTSCIPEL